MRRWDRVDTLFLAAISVVILALVAIGYSAFKDSPETGMVFTLAVLVGLIVSGGTKS